MKTFQQLQEGVYDPNIFNAIFLAGGPGSGKSYVVRKTTGGLGLKIVNSDDIYEKDLEKAGLDIGKPEDIFSDEGQAIRLRSKQKTKARQMGWVDGRLGIIIDGTADKLEKITRLKNAFTHLGYDCFMIFVNTSLDVALERNSQRERSVPEFVTIQSWNNCQKNIGQFQRVFSPNNFIIIDNNVSAKELVTQTLNRVSKVVAQYMRRPVVNYTAKKWIAHELELKRKK